MDDQPARTTDSLATGLARALARIGDARFGLAMPTGLERLSGGANMESWRFLVGIEACVLRRAPGGGALTGSRAIGLDTEAALIRAAHSGGVRAPEVLVELEPSDGIGCGFVMRALPGTPDPAQILAAEDPASLITQIAHELAAIHRINPADLPALPVLEPAAAVAELRARFGQSGGDRPILALALHWLAANLPPPCPPRLVHGDFRLGNLLVEGSQLTGVLDWELAHLGDPVEDLAYGCMMVWRFARPDRTAFGLGTIAQLTADYVAAGGEPVEQDRFRFWLVYRTAWWALGCLQMGQTWRDGTDRSLERVVVARRCAEQELDLLMLLERDAPEAERQRPVPVPAPQPEAGPGEPSAAEILTAVSEWLAADIKPLLTGRGRFDLAVARNALGIVARECDMRPALADADLAGRLLRGEATLAEPGLLARLRRSVLDKLSADMPKYPALALAKTAWEKL
jgi:aminoglycoside phosphotransferase (APT) family kinase protein